jgi:predicted signal transduction protein with EAL and GGDEF domain
MAKQFSRIRLFVTLPVLIFGTGFSSLSYLAKLPVGTLAVAYSRSAWADFTYKVMTVIYRNAACY